MTGVREARGWAGVVLSSALFIIILIGFWAHYSYFLHIGGDEVYFYFLSQEWFLPDYRPYYASVLEKLIALQAVTQPEAIPQLAVTMLNYPLQPDHFLEYKLPRAIWSAASAVVATPTELRGSGDLLPAYIGSSTFWMFVATGGVLAISVPAVLARRPVAALAVLLTLALVYFKESYPWATPGQFKALGWSQPYRGFVEAVLSANKGVLLYSFAARSNSLWLMLLFFALRWSRPPREEAWGYYVLLPLVSLVHASQGAMFAGIVLAVDLLSRIRALSDWRVSACYGITFALSLTGGQARSLVIFAPLAALSVALLLLSAVNLSQRIRAPRLVGRIADREATSWKRVPMPVVDVLLLLMAGLGVLMLFDAVAGSDRAGDWQRAVVGSRLGSILAVIVPAAVVFLLVGRARLLRTDVRYAVAAGVTATVVVVADAALTGKLVAPAHIEARLVSETTQFHDALAKPITFEVHNELHLIWSSIIRSAVAGKDLTVRISH